MENIEYRCLYCTIDLPGFAPDTRVPDVDDDAAWVALAQEHLDGCEWVQTRAHRVHMRYRSNRSDWAGLKPHSRECGT